MEYKIYRKITFEHEEVNISWFIRTYTPDEYILYFDTKTKKFVYICMMKFEPFPDDLKCQEQIEIRDGEFNGYVVATNLVCKKGILEWCKIEPLDFVKEALRLRLAGTKIIEYKFSNLSIS